MGDVMKNKLGTDLKVLRIYKNVSQEKMAEDLNVSRSTISNWETKRREIKLEDAILISNYFNVSMDNLFNPKPLNSHEFKQIAKRYFENEKISVNEKYETLKQIVQYKADAEIKELLSQNETKSKKN